MHKSVPALMGLMVGAAVIGPVGSASAQEGVAFKNLMGSVGLIPREKDPIRYRERAPLVLPPKSALPAPSASAAVSNPNWPTDPDVAAKRSRDEEERRPVTWSETRRLSDNNNTRLSPEEMQRGRVANNAPGVAPAPGTHRGDNARDIIMANPEVNIKSDNEVPVINGEPQRQNLSDPPTGMRRSATGKAIEAQHSAPAVDQQRADANPMTWITDRFRKNDDD